MWNKDSLTSIVVHCVVLLGVLIVNPMTGVLHSKPEIIMVRTLNIPDTPPPAKQDPIPELPKPKPVKVTKAIAQQPKPVERLRTIPDKVDRTTSPSEQLRNRAELNDNPRRSEVNDQQQRALPNTTPSAASIRSEIEQRAFANEETNPRAATDKPGHAGNHATETSGDETGAILASIDPMAASKSGTGRQNSGAEVSQRPTVTESTVAPSRNAVEGSETGVRSAAEGGPSHIKLDPYHYQMVSVCLRLCTKSMFSGAGPDQGELASSRSWLRVHNDKADYFEFNYHGRWMRFDVNARLLGDIATLDYVNLNSALAARSDADSLLEEMTRKLCSLFGYEGCLSKL